MRLLDLFCGVGGCAMGYHLAGFEVTGIDIASQPNYPFRYCRADAIDVLEDTEYLRSFDLVHGSPPCQPYSVTRGLARHSRPILIE